MLLDEKDTEVIKKIIQEASEAQRKDFVEMLKGAVKDGVNESKKEPAKEGILAIKDPYERQKMIAKHMDLFRK